MDEEFSFTMVLLERDIGDKFLYLFYALWLVKISIV